MAIIIGGFIAFIAVFLYCACKISSDISKKE